MENNTRKTKVFRDPVHGLITFDKEKEQVLLDLIDTPEFQRLRRIRQLGVAYVAYHGAVHTRFAHSLGVCHLAGLYMDQLYNYYKDDLFGTVEEFETKRILVRCAALLHDIGHGPFSHVFESAIKDINSDYNLSHEDWTAKIITDESTSIYQVLNRYEINHNDIVKIINNTYKDDAMLSKIVSSQFDADRMDYLQRDSLFAGVKYGLVDQEWLFHSLRQSDTDRGKVIAVDASKGKNSIISFIMARRDLFQQVYFHHKIRAAEIQLAKIIFRINHLIKESKQIIPNDSIFEFFDPSENSLIVKHYLALDDHCLLNFFNENSRTNSDIVLHKLCKNFMVNKIFKSELLPNDPSIFFDQRRFSNKDSNITDNDANDYFIGIDITKKTYYENDYTRGSKKPEKDDQDKERGNEIWIMSKDGKLEELSKFREIQAIMESEDNKTGEYHLCFDSEIFDRKEVIEIIR